MIGCCLVWVLYDWVLSGLSYDWWLPDFSALCSVATGFKNLMTVAFTYDQPSILLLSVGSNVDKWRVYYRLDILY